MAIPDPAITNWVPIWNPLTEGPAGPPGPAAGPHAPTHSPGGADPLVNAAWTDVANVFTVNQRISSGSLILGVNDATGTTIVTDPTGLFFVNGNNSAFKDAFLSRIFERSRSIALGEWIDVTYDAANFSTSGAMVWTVQSGDVSTYAYTLIGKTLVLSFIFSLTSISGTIDAHLKIKIPGGFLPSKNIETVGFAQDNGIATSYRIRAFISDAFVYCTRTDFVSWTASTNNTSVIGQVTIPIQ